VWLKKEKKPMEIDEPEEKLPEIPNEFDTNSFVISSKKYDRPTTIQHWQLRDLVHASSSTEFFYVFRKNVSRYSTIENKSAKVLELRYEPSCIGYGHNYLVAGGQAGQLAFMNLDTEKLWKIETLDGKINNSCTISKIQDEIHIVVTNNDNTIKIFNPTSTRMDLVAELKTTIAMNYASVSPNGELLVSTGDSRDVNLYSINGKTYNKTKTLREAKDSGMCCAWNSSSTQFAVASQDGSLCIWDIRSIKPMTKFHSRTPKSSGDVIEAFRNVKYSSSSMVDLLVFTEHTNNIHIVDARTYDNEQVISTVPNLESANISGISFSPDSSRIFVGLEGCIREYLVDTLRRRRFRIGTVN